MLVSRKLLIVKRFAAAVEVEGKFVRQSGGRGQYGHVWLKLEPKKKRAGYEFVNEIVGGVGSKRIHPSC